MNYRRLGACAAILAALTAASDIQAQPKRGDRVTVTGCPYAGVTGNCLMIRAPDGAVYNISSALPRPRTGSRMVRLRGVVTDRASACGEGVVLDRIRWVRTRQLCPK
jgi:hypothetical protein